MGKILKRLERDCQYLGKGWAPLELSGKPVKELKYKLNDSDSDCGEED